MKKRIIIFLCAVCLAGLTACGGKEPGLQVEAVTEPEEELQKEDDLNGKNEEEPQKEDNLSSVNEEEPQMEDELNSGNEENLEGNVKSIGNEGVILSKTFTYEMDDGQGLVAVSGVDENGEEVLITVNFSENTKYELRTVKNSGVNGDSDVTKQEASFSDIKEGGSLSLTGHYTVEGKEFAADYVVIYNFV